MNAYILLSDRTVACIERDWNSVWMLRVKLRTFWGLNSRVWIDLGGG